MPRIALAAFAAVGVVSHGVDAIRVVAAVVALAATGGFLPGRPAWQGLPAVLLSTAATMVVCDGSAGNPGWFAAITLVGWMAWVASPLVWVTEYLVVMAWFVAQIVIDTDHGWLQWMAGTSFAVVACWSAQHERQLAVQLRAAQAGLAERARVEERNRIAHEIHDAVAHALTVSLLHISSARLAIDEDPDEGRRLMAEAERTGRMALTEVRQAVGMLRQDGEIEGLLPGAGQVVRLVDTVRSAGADVNLEIVGSLDAVPNTTGVVLYRILQEALTNAVRHAPGARTQCRVAVRASEVVLAVDTLRSVPQGPIGRGTGLSSMQARAETVGGTCTAGAGDGVWRVNATLPLHAGAAG